MSVHWPIIRRLVARSAEVVLTDDQRSWRGIHLLAGACHLADEIERRCHTETVGIMLPTSGLFPMAALAGWMLGRTVVPLNYLLARDELQYVVDDCETDTIIGAGRLLDHIGFVPRCDSVVRLEELDFSGFPEPRWPARADDEDLAALLYTSGTTGHPKGVMLTHANLRANMWQSMRCARFTKRDVFLGVLPQFHSFGFTVLTLLPLTIGAGVVYTARFSPKRIIELVGEHRATVLVAIPSMYNALANAKSGSPEDFASLRFAVSGGEPLSEAVARAFREKFEIRINEGYGLTETAPVTNICLPEEFRPRSVGRPVERLEQRIIDLETGRTLPPGEEGEIRMRGPNVMRGYFKLPEETAETFDDEGFFRTGDMGRFDDDGHLFITGRIKEMIIIGGENVFPREIEEVLNQHESVAASGVVGVRDPSRGEVPLAFVELADGVDRSAFSDKAIRSFCRERLAGYKIPREIRVVDELPRGPTGKVLRRSLAEQVKMEGMVEMDSGEEEGSAEDAQAAARGG